MPGPAFCYLHPHLGRAARGAGAGPHLDAAAAVLDRVADQVGQDPLDPARIGAERQRPAADRDLVLPAPPADQRGGDRRDVDLAVLDRLCARVQPGDLHQLVDQRPEPAYVGDQQLDRAACRFWQLAALLAQQRSLGDQRGQRRAQLVCDVGCEPPLACLRGYQFGDLRLERVGHLIEGRGPRAELIGRAGGQPRVEPAAGDQPRGLAGPGDRLERPPREQTADERREQDDAEPRGGERVA